MQRSLIFVAVVYLSNITQPLCAMARQCETALKLYGAQEGVSPRLKIESNTPNIVSPDFHATRIDGLQTIQQQLTKSDRYSAVWIFNPETSLWRDVSQRSPSQDIATANTNLVRDLSSTSRVLEYYTVRSPSLLKLLYNDTIFSNASDTTRGLLPLREDFQDLWNLRKLHPVGSAIVYGIVFGDSVTYLIGPTELFRGEVDIKEFTDFSSTLMYGIMSLEGMEPKIELITHIITLLHYNVIGFDKDGHQSGKFGAKVAHLQDLGNFDKWSSSIQTSAKPL